MSKSRKVKGKGKAAKKPAPKQPVRRASPHVHKFAGKKPASRVVSSPRKAVAKEEPLHESPHIHKFAKPKTKASSVDDDEMPSAKDEIPSARDEMPSAKEVKPVPKGMAARLAAMAAAAADEAGEPEVATRKPAPARGPVAWEELEDDDATPSAREPKSTTFEADEPSAPAHVEVAKVGDGVEVVAKGPSKFSKADLELLRASIKVKGSANIVEGINFDELKWDSEGLLPVVAQDRRTGAVLMLAWTNKETLEATLKTKQMTYWSRSRGKVWQKGEESGHVQRMVKLSVDCDKDSILALVDQEGPACHRDTGTCWNNDRALPIANFLGELDQIIHDYAKNPKADSYTSKLLKEPRLGLEKLVEEVNETLRVLQGKPNKDPLEHEAADLIYHLLVACRTKGIGMDQILTELYSRHLAAQIKG